MEGNVETDQNAKLCAMFQQFLSTQQKQLKEN